MTRFPFLRATFALCLLAVLGASPALAHEFIVKPVKFTASVGESVPFSVVSAHVMMISEEIEPLQHVELTLLQGAESTQLNAVPNEMLLTADGRAAFTKPGTAILAGHRGGVVWTNTTKGWVEGSKKGLTGVISSSKYEKFCKSFVTVGQADDAWKTVLGQKLEILPLADPAALRPGDVLPVRVLFDGKPAAGETVLATYDGFSYDEMAFAGSYEADENGVANVRITAPGVWMVRVQHVESQPTEEYDSHALRSVMLLEVR